MNTQSSLLPVINNGTINQARLAARFTNALQPDADVSSVLDMLQTENLGVKRIIVEDLRGIKRALNENPDFAAQVASALLKGRHSNKTRIVRGIFNTAESWLSQQIATMELANRLASDPDIAVRKTLAQHFYMLTNIESAMREDAANDADDDERFAYYARGFALYSVVKAKLLTDDAEVRDAFTLGAD